MDENKSIRRARYSTAGLAAGVAHASWSERGWPSIAALFKSTPIGAFSTSADDFGVEDIAISYASGTARVLERTPERIAADRIDTLGVGLLLEGAMAGITASREFQLGPGEILLFDLSQQITMTMSDSKSVQLAIPRARAEALLGSVAAFHGMVMPQAVSAPFHDHVLKLRDTLEKAEDEDGPAIASSLLAFLGQALHPAS